MKESFDVIIIGAGIVGLTLAACLAQQNLHIAMVETQPPELDWNKAEFPMRVSAINLHSYELWHALGIWQHIEETSIGILDQMQIWDAKGGGEVQFFAREVGLSELGFIVENRAVIKAVWQWCEKQSNIHFYCPAKTTSIEVNEKNTVLTLQNKKMLNAKLMVGADGAQSWVRSQMNIKLTQRSYQQQALVAVIETQKSHHQVAFQSFLSTGPLGVLPLHHPHYMSIVWSAESSQIKNVLEIDAVSRSRALSEAMQWRLGDVKFITEPHVFPLIMQHAKPYVKPRMALVGDAAHVIHPLAGQGVNLGLKDVASLANELQEATTAKRDLGSLRVLRAYERSRKADNTFMLMAMCAFKKGFCFDASWWVYLRSLGLNVTNQLPWLKRWFMHYPNKL